MNQSNNEQPETVVAAEDVHGHVEDYSPFYKATIEGDKNNIESFIESHPEALTTTFPQKYGGGTALHYMLDKLDNLDEGDVIAALLVDRMMPDDLKMVDKHGDTPLATAIKSHSCPVDVLKLMVNKNPNLANMRDEFPVYLASENMLKDMTNYLYSVTDKSILLSMEAETMSSFLWNLVHMNLFGIASDLVQDLPNNLQGCPYHTISALARKFSGTAFQDIRIEALAFLRLVWSVQSCAYDEWFDNETCAIIVENAENGSTEFVKELFQIRPDILKNSRCRAKIFVHAVEKREKNIFNLVYKHIQPKDLLETFEDDLSDDDKKKNNILHLATKLAPSYVLNRKSGAVLQMQSELQWFQEVWNLASPECREARNSDRFTPRELLIERHKPLKEAGEKSMKEIAQSCTVVGALIVTIMFAAAFTLPGGNDQNTGLPVFLKGVMLKVFIICDAISLYSSTTSVLACLGILTSRYAEDDFLVSLPRKLMISLSTLFFSITTMMIAFCAAIAIMLDGNLQLILPVVVLALVPIVIFLLSTVSLLFDTYVSTYKPSIIDKNTKLLLNTRGKKPMVKPSSTAIRRLPTKKRGEMV